VGCQIWRMVIDVYRIFLSYQYYFPLMWHCSERFILTSQTFPLMRHCSERSILTNQINVFYIKVTSCEWGHNIECYLPKVLIILVRQENPININNHPPNLTAHVINVFCCCSLPNISQYLIHWSSEINNCIIL
jgi:hypothetical protein